MAKSKQYYMNLARQAAQAHGIDPDIFIRQIEAESGFNPNAVSPAGAQGISQIMPATAQGWNVDPMNPRAALYASAKAMSKYIKSYGGWRNALVAYNAGPGRVGKPLYSETSNYIDKILGGADPKVSTAAAATGPSPAGSNAPEGDSRRERLMSYIFKDSPFEDTIKRLIEGENSSGSDGGSSPQPARGGGGGGGKQGKLKNWRDLQKLGRKYGLEIQGVNQTTSGKHASNSPHYSGKAIDFGDANNSRQEFEALANYLKQNPHLVNNMIYNPLGWGILNGKVVEGASWGGHDDHMHIDVRKKRPMQTPPAPLPPEGMV